LAWTIELSNAAERALKKLDRQTRRRVAEFIDTRLIDIIDPRQIGKRLQGSLHDYWAYRVGDYRLICDIQDNRLIVLVVDIGHRSGIYR
jgi:mRNA interferase RelE/StbE